MTVRPLENADPARVLTHEFGGRDRSSRRSWILLPLSSLRVELRTYVVFSDRKVFRFLFAIQLIESRSLLIAGQASAKRQAYSPVMEKSTGGKKPARLFPSQVEGSDYQSVRWEWKSNTNFLRYRINIPPQTKVATGAFRETEASRSASFPQPRHEGQPWALEAYHHDSKTLQD